MKKTLLTYGIGLALGTAVFAGGDIAPVEPVVETPVVVNDDAGFYVGLGYGYVNADLAKTVDPGFDPNRDSTHDALLLQAGYKVNRYVAVEGRYWLGSDDDFYVPKRDHTKTFDAWGLYVKPMYPVTEKFDVYALLGYADLSSDFTVHNPAGDVTTNLDDGGFSWGVGASYEFTDHIAMFVDYVSIYNDTQTHVIKGKAKDYDIDDSVWSVGVSYRF
jgi:opacity protein-like surface antigen